MSLIVDSARNSFTSPFQAHRDAIGLFDKIQAVVGGVFGGSISGALIGTACAGILTLNAFPILFTVAVMGGGLPLSAMMLTALQIGVVLAAAGAAFGGTSSAVVNVIY